MLGKRALQPQQWSIVAFFFYNIRCVEEHVLGSTETAAGGKKTLHFLETTDFARMICLLFVAVDNTEFGLNGIPTRVCFLVGFLLGASKHFCTEISAPTSDKSFSPASVCPSRSMRFVVVVMGCLVIVNFFLKMHTTLLLIFLLIMCRVAKSVTMETT